MKHFIGKLLKIVKWVCIILTALIVIEILVIVIGRQINRRTPEGGINESMYADINGTKQWICIYGQDLNNPVLLFLHGGPCYPSIVFDWIAFRKLSADYTIVEWDQRGCGHNYPDYQETEPITGELMIEDGKAMTDFLCDYLHKEKITLYGHSWGSLLAANLALEYPEKYDALITSGLVVNEKTSQRAYRDHMLSLSENDPDIHAAAEQFDPEAGMKNQKEIVYRLAYSQYSYNDNLFRDSDFSIIAGILFNPYCTVTEQYRQLMYTPAYDEYIDTVLTGGDIFGDELCGQIPIDEKTEYQVPFYLIDGTKDHGFSTMVEVAAAYFDTVSAPDKEMIYVDGGHGSPLLHSGELAAFVRQIAEKQSGNTAG